ncbi:MAG: aspartate 1-decarboxylase [Candidatus Omnitrophica bacterium]|nr:aspartate 1-decarboxylase [Candidatus Omnitrophota bacterium]MDD5573800.1 aspartate 1-decarboxylase [Candidatus Omnitrophota bacterium]
MYRIMCKSKIHRARVTGALLHYEGSIAVDTDLLQAADILPGEKVEVLNMNNGSRIETYAIAGKKGTGEMCLNGPAARSGCEGDEIIILAYALVPDTEAKNTKMKVVHVDPSNKIKNTLLR